MRELLERRRFPSPARLPEPWASFHRGEVRIPPIPNPISHRLRLAE